MNSSNLSYQSMNCVIKWGNQFMSSTTDFFIPFKAFIMQLRKNRAERSEIKRMSSNCENWYPTIPRYNIC